MPDHPEYGTNIRALLPPIDTEKLRETIRQEVRRTLNELAPGVDPGMIFDILVDVSVSRAQEVQTEINVGIIRSALHSVSYLPPTTSASGASNWVSNSRDPFRTEYMAEFEPANPEPFEEVRRHHDDMVDSMHYAAGIDRAHGRDRTGFFNPTPTSHDQGPFEFRIDTHARMNMAPPVRVPPLPIHSNPSVRLDEIQNRRFDLIDRRVIPRPHPIINAVVRAKMNPPKPTPIAWPTPKPGKPMTTWERIRANYALFE